MIREPLCLYSTNSWLAYVIAERYGGQKHFVWCCPYFDHDSSSPVDATTPPTSTPRAIYRALAEETLMGDRHSTKIADNRKGILKGARERLKAGELTVQECQEIGEIVKLAETGDFRPLVYVIPFAAVRQQVRSVPVHGRAHPLSNELLIERLPRSLFDVLVI
jgi:hypothetical protein